MLQYHSGLAAIASRSFRAFSLAPKRALATGTSSGCTADPEAHSIQPDREVQTAVPSGKPEEKKKHYEPKQGDRREAQAEAEGKHYFRASMEKFDPLSPPRPPHASSPRLESIRVQNPAEAIVRQKQEFSSTLDDVSCAGLDGSPWPNDQEQNSKSRERVEDDKEYFKHHKASPLSEIKFVDTRKPITRAADGTADTESPYGHGRDVIGWLPEQLDTAEEALERARRIWTENATRGDPYSPHGRVLRELRGEWF